MGHKASTWAWEQPLKSHLKFLLVALADYANPPEYVVWPSLATLCKMVGVSDERNLRRRLRILEEDGYITTVPRYRKNKSQTSNAYRLNVGIMLIGGGVQALPPGGHTATPSGAHKPPLYEPLIEPPEGTTNGEQSLAEEEMPKEFGQGDIDEALKAAQETKVKNPTDAIPGLKKKGTQYLTSALEHIFKVAYAHNGYGFLAEFTMQQKGQFSQFQKKLQGLDAAETICVVLDNWNRFRELTDAYHPPKRPSIGFMLKHVSVAGEMFVQSLAKPEKHVAKPLFKPKDEGENLTNDTGKSENDKQALMDYLENLDT